MFHGAVSHKESSQVAFTLVEIQNIMLASKQMVPCVKVKLLYHVITVISGLTCPALNFYHYFYTKLILFYTFIRSFSGKIK